MKLILLFFCFFFLFVVDSAITKAQPELSPEIPPDLIPDDIVQLAIKNGAYIQTQMIHTPPGQKFTHLAAAYHSKNCKTTIRTIRQYENFRNYLPFIKESTYNSSTKEIYFLFDSPLMPRRMSLSFKLERFEKQGVYPYTFVKGLFPGLTGNIHIKEFEGRCLLYLTAHWQGADSGLPDLVVEIFVKTLTLMAVDRLFRISTL